MAELGGLTAVIEDEAKALGFDLVRVKLFGGPGDQTLQVMAERPETGQLTIDDCADLSRRISDHLDAMEEAGTDPIEGEYRLEVSSPGIDRPLTRLKDFTNWIGHEARIVLAAPIEGRKVVTGLLKSVNGDVIAVYTAKSGEIDVAFGAVASAKLQLTDALIAATRPLSMEGADEEEFEDDDTPEGAEHEELN